MIYRLLLFFLIPSLLLGSHQAPPDGANKVVYEYDNIWVTPTHIGYYESEWIYSRTLYIPLNQIDSIQVAEWVHFMLPLGVLVAFGGLGGMVDNLGAGVVLLVIGLFIAMYGWNHPQVYFSVKSKTNSMWMFCTDRPSIDGVVAAVMEELYKQKREPQ